jgi:hypothetical protein
MSFRWKLGTAQIAVCLAFLACNRSSVEVEGSATQPLLSVPSPIDSDSGKSTWTGTSHELLLADAIVACTLPADTTVTTPAPVRTFGDQISDRVFDRVRQLMDVTLANYKDSMGDVVRARRWLRVRSTPTSNALAMANWKGSVELMGAFPKAYVLPDLDWNPDRGALQEALEVAGVNFCLARTLKEQLGLDSTFLMTKVEQRELYQAARERAQIAMLQLSNLFRALSLAQGAPTAAMDPAIRAASALKQQGAFADQLSQYAKDLSDLVLWEIEITGKLSDLLMRSASAHDPLPGSTALPRDGLQSGSWRQRVLALLYGGNPLSTGEPGVPPVSETVLARDEVVSSMLRWPIAADVPAASPGLWTPQAIRFKAYLERFDTFSLVLKSDAPYAEPSDIDQTQTAIWLYRELEAKLRQRACPAQVRAAPPAGQRWCAALDPTQIAEAIDLSPQAVPSTDLLTYRVHGFKPSDALQLAKAVVDIMPSLSGTDGFFIGGAVRQVSLPGRPNPALTFDKPRFAPRSVLEMASTLGSRGRHRIPSLIDATDPSGTRPLTPLLDGRFTWEARPLDEVAALGAVPALAAVREALADSALSAYLGASPDPRSLIDTAIGKQQVSIRPVERAVYAGGTQIVQPRDWALRSLWKINVTTDSADPFWSGGTLGQYTFYAVVGDPSILHLLADPSSEKFGLRSLDDLTTRGNWSLSLIRPQKTGDGYSASIYLPAQIPVVFFARRSQVVGGVAQYSYKPLTGSVRLWSDWRYGIGNVGLPLDSQYYAVGGSLTRIATAATAVMPWDFSEPAIDGFGQFRGFSPVLQIDGSEKDSLLLYRDKVFADARGKAENAQAAVKKALDNVRTAQFEQINVDVERRRELNNTSQLLTKACGAAKVDAEGADNQCDIEFMEVKALGDTALDLANMCGSITGTVDPIVFDWQAASCDVPPAKGQDDPHKNEKRARCTMAALTSQVNASLEVAKQVGCAQYQAAFSAPEFRLGSLAEGLQAQHGALTAFRSRMRELRAEGLALIEAGKVLDNELELAKKRADALKKAQEIENLEAFRNVNTLTGRVITAESDYQDACEFLAELTDTSVESISDGRLDVGELIKAGGKGMLASVASSIAAGAAVASVAPGVGTVIGGLVGGLTAIAVSLSGPSEEEQLVAKNDVERKKLALDQARNDLKGELDLFEDRKELDSIRTIVQELETIDVRLKANANYAASVTRLQERLSAVKQAAFELAKTNLSLKNDVLNLHLAIQKARFETQQVAHRAEKQFAVSQLYFGRDMYDAYGALEAARRWALYARQAVEYSMLLNLSKIDQGSNSVGPPSQWVDQLYDADLSGLRIVGLSSVPMNSEVFSDNKMLIFMSNLETFVKEWPGPGRNIAIVNNAGRSFMLSPPSPAAKSSDGSSWLLECPRESSCAAEGGWCPAHTSLAGVCISRTTGAPLMPKRLRVLYPLNSRGELGRAAAAPLVNSRWYRILVNTGISNIVPDADGILKVTPVKDCSLARPDWVQDCIHDSGSLDYSLKHIAPFVALDADGRWQLLSLRDGYKTVGRSAATTMYIDPQISGNSLDPSKSWADFVNYQSKGFPVEGWYELTLDAKTDDGSENGQIITDLTALPKIKVLFDSTHWNVQ